MSSFVIPFVIPTLPFCLVFFFVLFMTFYLCTDAAVGVSMLDCRCIFVLVLWCISFYFRQTCFICPVKQTKPVTCTCDWVWEKEYSHWCGVITCVSWKEIWTRSSCSCTQCVILHRTWLPAYSVCVFVKPPPPPPPPPSLFVFENKPFSHGLKSAEEQNWSSVLCVSSLRMFSATWLVCILEVLITHRA